MIIIFTKSDDLGADLVIRHLARGGVNYKRLNTDHLGTPNTHIDYIDGTLALFEGEQCIRADEIHAAWCRRFAVPLALDAVDPGYREFTNRELAFLLDAFISTVRGVQINPYEVDRLAGNRLVQARRAAAAGFLTPDTIVTQDQSLARQFRSKHAKVVTKAISFGLLNWSARQRAYTSLVEPNFDTSGLTACPALFQEYIPKLREWRITTVCDRVFAARTRNGISIDTVDWRRSQDIAGLFELADPPSEVNRKLVSLCSSSGLLFGTHDLIETPRGDFYFLETNPSGQWGWLEVLLGQPIGHALASVLCSATIR